jgi:hypothetical protein
MLLAYLHIKPPGVAAPIFENVASARIPMTHSGTCRKYQIGILKQIQQQILQHIR